MYRQQCEATGIMGNQGNMISPKETNKTPRTDPREREVYDLSDKEFRIILLKKFSELQENTDNQMKLGKTVHEQNEKFSKEIETIKKKPSRNSRRILGESWENIYKASIW